MGHQVLLQPGWECCLCPRHKVRHVFSLCWTLPGFPLVSDSVAGVRRVSALETWEKHPAFCGWCGFVGFIGAWPSACTGVVFSQVWKGQDESQNLQNAGHGSLVENSAELRVEEGTGLKRKNDLPDTPHPQKRKKNIWSCILGNYWKSKVI